MGRTGSHAADCSANQGAIEPLKSNRLIARILLYALLVASIAAAWVAVTALRTPAPQLAEDDLSAFESAVNEQTAALADAHREALGKLGSIEKMSAPPGGIEGTSTRGELENARERASAALTVGIGATAWEMGSFEGSPALDEALDEADRLYEQSIEEQVSLQEAFVRESLARQEPDHIRLVGYRALQTTLGRDIVRYKLLESLPIQEIKLDYYRNEFDRANYAIREEREFAQGRKGEIRAEVESRYDPLLAEIVNEFAASLADGEAQGVEPAGVKDLLRDIRARIAGFSARLQHDGLSSERPPQPEFDRTDWVETESSRVDKVASVLSENGGK